MDYNIDNLFKMDSDLEKNGVWFRVSDTTRFLLRRMGGNNASEVKKAYKKHFAPYAKLIELGTLSADLEKDALARVIVDACLISWEGVKDGNGTEIPYSKEAALAMFKKLPMLAETLLEESQRVDHFRVDLGNFSQAT